MCTSEACTLDPHFLPRSAIKTACIGMLVASSWLAPWDGRTWPTDPLFTGRLLRGKGLQGEESHDARASRHAPCRTHHIHNVHHVYLKTGFVSSKVTVQEGYTTRPASEVAEHPMLALTRAWRRKERQIFDNEIRTIKTDGT